MDIKHYITKQFSQVQPPVESNSEKYENGSNNSTTAQDKFMVNKKPSDKEKQPALASREHLNMQTPILLNITSNNLLINQIMAYWDIAKLKKFSGEEDNAYS
ncbi:hypothetical protein G9A89_013682 [Geosiphon pyriformis]|nr:hypothetical protein G9A89_013682 [Geosiphon pyriformis]